MTKTIQLEYENGWYILPKPITGEKVKSKPILCERFVRDIVHNHNQPLKHSISVLISTEPIEEAIEIAVLKGGYYRWTWRFLDRKQDYFGMRRGTEDELSGFFSDDKDNDMFLEQKLWIKIK